MYSEKGIELLVLKERGHGEALLIGFSLNLRCAIVSIDHKNYTYRIGRLVRKNSNFPDHYGHLKSIEDMREIRLMIKQEARKDFLRLTDLQRKVMPLWYRDFMLNIVFGENPVLLERYLHYFTIKQEASITYQGWTQFGGRFVFPDGTSGTPDEYRQFQND